MPSAWGGDGQVSEQVAAGHHGDDQAGRSVPGLEPDGHLQARGAAEGLAGGVAVAGVEHQRGAVTGRGQDPEAPVLEDHPRSH